MNNRSTVAENGLFKNFAKGAGRAQSTGKRELQKGLHTMRRKELVRPRPRNQQATKSKVVAKSAMTEHDFTIVINKDTKCMQQHVGIYSRSMC